MRIFTSRVREYEKIISLLYVPGDRFQETAYLNFEDGFIYFNNPNFISRIKFESETEGDSVENVFVDIPTFIALCKQYDHIDVSKDFIFSNGKEKFKLPHFTEKYSVPEFNFDECEATNELTPGVIKAIKSAVSYTGPNDPSENYAGILLDNTSVAAFNGSMLYESNVIEDTNKVDTPIKLPPYVIKFISSIQNKKINLYRKKHLLYLDLENFECTLIFSEVSNLKFPPISNENFIAKYNHKDHLVIEKIALIEVLQFFASFVKNVINERLYITVNEDTIQVESKDGSVGNRIVPIVSVSEDLIGKEIIISRPLILQSVASIEDDFIKIQYDDNAPAFNVVGKSNNLVHVAVIRLK